MKIQSVALLSALGMSLCGSAVYLFAPAAASSPIQGASAESTPGPLEALQDLPKVSTSFETGATLHMEGHVGHGLIEKGKGRSTFLMVEASASGDAGEGRGNGHLAIVIDRSGSMKGDRLPRALAAAKSAVDHLDDGDRVSVVSFDTQPVNEVSMTTVDASTRPSIKAAIDNISLGGDTCISCGIGAGITELRRSEGAADQMIVLSDGDATAGIRDVPGFESIARSAREVGIGVSTIGVGTSYNQKILGAIALHSGGGHYFIEDAASLERVFLAEAERLQKTVALSATMTVDLAEGVTLERVYDRSFKRDGQRLTVTLGNFSAGDKKTLLLEVKVPAEREGIAKLADVALRFEDRKVGGQGACQGSLETLIATEGSELDPLIAARIERTKTASTLREVNDLLEEGRVDEAEAKLEQQQSALAAAADRATRAAPAGKADALAKDFAAQSSAVAGAKKTVVAKPKGVDAERAKKKNVEMMNPFML